MQRRASQSRWADFVWEPVGVVPSPGGEQRAAHRAGRRRAVAASGLQLELHATRPRAITSILRRRSRASSCCGAWRASRRCRVLRDRELARRRPLDGRRSLGRRRGDAGRDLRLGGRIRREELPAGAARSASSRARSCIPRTASDGGRTKEAFLSRWSRLKHEARRAGKAALEARKAERRRSPRRAAAGREPHAASPTSRRFMQPKVDDALRRVALKKLFGDPHFNMPDPFEPFSGDWTVAEPIPPEMLATLNQARTLLFATRRRRRSRAKAAKPPGAKKHEAAMSLEGKTLKVCSCNRTVALDAKALAAALEAERAACRARPAVPQGRRRVPGGARRERRVIVACTQEAALFGELAERARSRMQVRQHPRAGRLVAAARRRRRRSRRCVAMAALPEPEPVPAVEFKSAGRAADHRPGRRGARLGRAAVGAARRQRPVLAGRAASCRSSADIPVWSGRVTELSGWLGAFEVEWQQENPIDLELCTRCNACVRACPEKRDRLRLPGRSRRSARRTATASRPAARSARSISRARDAARNEAFDLVLDLSREPLVRMHQPPQGYFAPGDDPLEQALAAQQLARAGRRVREAEVLRLPREDLRAQPLGQDGLQRVHRRLLERRDQRRRRPRQGRAAPVRGLRRLRHGVPVGRDDLRLSARAGPRRAAEDAARRPTARPAARTRASLFHDAARGPRGACSRTAATGTGLPARVIPLECFHVASIGMDLVLGAIAYGASQVAVLVDREGGRRLRRARSSGRSAIAQTILNALGYAGSAFRHRARDSARSAAAARRAATVAKPATLQPVAGEAHHARFRHRPPGAQAPTPKDEIALPAGAPFGAIAVNKEPARCARRASAPARSRR